MKNEITQAELGLLAGKRNYRALREQLLNINDIDIAFFLNSMPLDEAYIIFRTLPKKQAQAVFAELSSEVQISIVDSITDREVSSLIEALALDDAVDMLEEMPFDLVNRVLKQSSSNTRALLNQYLKYPDNSVGSIMTPEFTSFSKEITAKDAVSYIREHGQGKETIYTCYVVSDYGTLEGVVTIRDLLTAADNETVEEIMTSHIISVTTQSDREDAAHLLGRYNFISLPVVDDENRLVGIVTIDDAADVIFEETTEDIERMAGIKPSEKPYLKTGIFELAQNRFFWLFILMISGVVSEMILSSYEVAISSVPVLVAFIPLLTDMGGDAGSQVSTLVIRGMALDEIRPNNLFVIMGKEFAVSFLVGIPLGILNFIRVILDNPDKPMVAFAISTTLVCTILMANTLGVILPMFAKKIRLDPALMATPMIATLVDILSMLIYFTIATALLSL